MNDTWIVFGGWAFPPQILMESVSGTFTLLPGEHIFLIRLKTDSVGDAMAIHPFI
jgi:hypothetical protein